MKQAVRRAPSALIAIAFCAAALSPSTYAAEAARSARFDWFRYEGADPIHQVAKPGPNEYRNPILSGFYPDPSITRVGDDYYLVHSTFGWFPGIPVFHSRDLVNWTQIGNAIDRPSQLDFKRLGLSRGVFAPAIEWHNGTFYILNTCVDCGGNFLITAKNPAGPWSDPIWLPDLEGGIDPSLFFDKDGRAYILNNGPPEGEPQYDGHRAIWIQEFDPKAMRTVGPRKVLVNGGVNFAEKPIWIEGPHIFREGGYYYLIAAEGGTAEGHSQVVLRAKTVWGPYEADPNNPILTQRDLPRDRPHPITSAGHADFVKTRNGEWWATFLAVRPYGDDLYNTGRETFLLPVTWKDGWPRITAPGQAIPYTHRKPNLPAGKNPPLPTTGPFTVTEEFSAPTLPLHWIMLRNPRETWFDLKSQPGFLTLTARPETLGENGNPSFLARRQQHLHASASTVVQFRPEKNGDRAGLAAFQSDEYWYLLSVGKHEGKTAVLLERRAGAKDSATGTVIASIPLDGNADAPVYLKIQARGGRYDFFYARTENAWQPLVTDADGTILSTKVAGGFVGSMFGLYAHSAAQGTGTSAAK